MNLCPIKQTVTNSDSTNLHGTVGLYQPKVIVRLENYCLSKLKDNMKCWTHVLFKFPKQ